jgi:hypothetical protein
MARAPTQGTAASAARYLTLFSVSIRHDYYNDRHDRCPDLRVRPTPACAALMASLGLLFRDLGTGFAVLVPQAKAEALASYVAGRGPASTWLSFLLVPTNPQFVPITALPIDTNLRASNLHLTNLRTDASEQLPDGDGTKPDIVLTGTTAGATALLPVTGSTLTVPTPTARTARLADLAGARVSAPASAAAGATSFDLSGFPYGLYSVRYEDSSGRPAAAPRGAQAEHLYVPTAPTSLCLLDLLLARPDGAEAHAAAFPLAGEAIRPVALTIGFTARETIWRYFVVAQGRSSRFAEDLAISGEAASFDRSGARLPNGEEAALFTASAALPLRRRSPHRFRLSGQRQNGSGARDEIEIDRLPTAPAAPVWPSGDPLEGASEIYVYV